MLGNRSRDTKPELALRRAVHALGLRYRVDVAPLPTLHRRADLVFRRGAVAVFLDGCFWHGCPEHYKPPRGQHAAYWADKIEGNVRRDRETDVILRSKGWCVLRIWEHESPATAAVKVATAVTARRLACGTAGA